MTYRTEGMSPLEHFNLVMEEIRAGRGLATVENGTGWFGSKDFERWKLKYAPAHVDGVSVLLLIVSYWGTFKTDVENYELLLKATYGECTLLGEPDPNVKVQGPGTFTMVDFLGTIQWGENFVRTDRIGQEEMTKIIYGEAVLGQEYDEIHIIGHGDDKGKGGMLFYPPDDEGKRPGDDSGQFFNKEKSLILCKQHSWPLKPRGKVLLLGCDVHVGGFKEFIESAVGSGNVHASKGTLFCNSSYVGGKKDRRLALDWYDKEQFEPVRDVAVWLNLPKAR
jgi:hypothetical protein